MPNFKTLIGGMLSLLAFVSTAPGAEPPAGNEPLSLRKDIAYRRSQGHTKVITALAYTPDSKILVAASLDGKIRLWDADATRVLRTLDTSSLELYAIAISPDGKLLASGGSWQEIQIWEIATGKLLQTLKGHSAQVAALAFSPDGKLLASGGYDKSIRLWDTGTWKEKRKITKDLGRVTALTSSPDGKSLASGGTLTSNWKGLEAGQADVVRLWDATTGRLKEELPIQGSFVAFAPDGRSIMSGGHVVREEQVEGSPGRTGLNGYSSIVLYDLQVRRKLLDTTRSGIGCVISHSADWYWYATTQGTLEIQHLDGNVIGSDRASEWSVRVWDLQTRQEAAHITSHYQKTANYETITAFSPDVKWLAIGHFRGQVLVRALHPDGKNPLLSDSKLSSEAPADIWASLSCDQADVAYAARWALLKSPSMAVKLAKDHVKPVPSAQGSAAKQAVANLSDREFRVRERAKTELQQDGWDFMPLLRRARSDATTAEERKRLDDLLGDLLTRTPPEEYLAQSRMIGVLESINSPESRAFLRELGGGASEATLTQAAQAALRRPKP